MVRIINIVNDFAKRGMALIQSYYSIFTKNDNQKLFFLQIVENHRKKFSDARKSTIISNSSQ